MISDLPIQAVLQLGPILVYVWLIAALGRRMLRSVSRRGPLERLVLDFTLGYAALGLVLFAVGVAGRIARGPILALLAVVAVVCARDGLEVARDALALVVPRPRVAGRRWWSVALPVALVVAPMLVLSLYPPFGYDALNYHLPYVKSFVEAGRLTTDWTLRFPVFPQLVEVVLAVPYLLLGDRAAESFLLAPTFAVAGVVAVWAARAGGRTSGPVAAAIWLGSPLVVWLSSQAYVDSSLSLFVVAALYAVDAWRARRGRSWLVLAGVFAGSACGCKYLGLPWVGLVAGLVLLLAGNDARVRSALTVAVLAGAIAAPWYGRIGLETGNPVFPVFQEVLEPGGEWSASEDAFAGGGRLGEPSGRPRPDPRLSRGVIGLLALPASVTWAREAFDHQAPVTPWALPVFLAIVWRARRDRRLLVLLLVCTAFAATFLVQPRIALRFVLPIVAVLSAAGAVALRPLLAWAFAGLRVLSPRRARLPVLEAVAVLGLLGFGALYGAYKVAERGVPPTDEEGRRAFLARWVPGYPAVEHLNGELGSAYVAYGLGLERVRYFSRGRFLGDWLGPYRFPLVESLLERPKVLHERLRSWGVDHLITRRAGEWALSATGLDGGEAPCFGLVWRDAESEVRRLATLDEAGECTLPGEADGVSVDLP